ncbi:MAG: selenocysteine-specific translation elongation factor [Verrucomicrobia bacterium]|nr:selenocysteine-specific translation elongation factor [Verrucomicrobiota bacterium]
MNIHHYILATAGHVDHGKSALVKALTGTDPDRLPEEKARGITIDLGFAHLELPAPENTPAAPPLPAPRSTFSLGIVDVPGHEDFVKNMVAGVGSIDLALFIVAADDGWMPQTEEHLQILSYLGVSRAVVALTKSDLAETEAPLADAIAQVREQLRESPFAQAPIVPTSVVKGTGLEELKLALARVLCETPAPRDIGKPRLPVDRVFVLRGIGTVVTGTLIGGILKRGQAVVIQPSGKASRIRSLQSHNREVETAGPGTRTALNLPDVARHSEQESEGIQRGDVITLAELGGASDTLDVALIKSARLRDSKSGAARPLKDGTLVRVHHGSGNVAARVSLLGREALEPGESALAQFRCESPLFALAGDRFIVRDWSEQWTLGGGVILDPEANRKRFRSEAQRKFLETRAGASDQPPAFVSSLLARDGAVRRGAFLVKSRFSASEIAEAASQLLANGQAISVGDWLADAGRWQTLRKQGADAIDAHHRSHPQHLGFQLSELRRAVEGSLPLAEMFDALAADLCRNGFVQAGTTIRRSTHRPALPPQLQAAGNRLRAILSAKPFEPPSRKELAPDSTAQQALRFLVETGEAMEVGDEVVLLADAYARATQAVKQFLQAHQSATVSELRQAIGASRRIVVPLLERLDKEGVTRREGDQRVLRQK